MGRPPCGGTLITVTNDTTTILTDGELMDFSSQRGSIKFRVDADVFEAVADIPAELALEYADKTERLTSGESSFETQKEIIHSLFRMVLLPESADRFIARLSDRRNPIGQAKIGRITEWLFEEYGLRPTESDSASSTGSGSLAAGTSLTVST